MYTCAVKMFCKASFISLMGSLKGNIGFKYSYIIFVQLNTLVIHQSIKGIEWPLHEPIRLGLLDTSGKCCYRTYLKKVVVTTTDNNELFCSFYLRFHPFHLHLNLNAFFEGCISMVLLWLNSMALSSNTYENYLIWLGFMN